MHGPSRHPTDIDRYRQMSKYLATLVDRNMDQEISFMHYE